MILAEAIQTQLMLVVISYKVQVITLAEALLLAPKWLMLTQFQLLHQESGQGAEELIFTPGHFLTSIPTSLLLCLKQL